MTDINEAIEQESTQDSGGRVDPLVIKPITKRKYLANCIWRIQNNERCHISRRRERDEDIADAILVSAESGVDHAHDYLRGLVEAAEHGKYEKAL